MKYSLAIHKKGYETLDIENFSTLRDGEKFNEKSLEDIISFTSDFTCEEALIESLLNFSLIPKTIMMVQLVLDFTNQILLNLKCLNLEYHIKKIKKYLN